jgi:hypothetical protein
MLWKKGRDRLNYSVLSFIIFINGCKYVNTPQSILPPELSIDEYQLVDTPSIEPFSFLPVSGTSAEILAKHQKEREDILEENCPFFASSPGTPIQLGNSQLVALEIYSDPIAGQGALESVSIQVKRDNEIIYTIPAGVGSPISNYRGLWIYSNHWVLENANVNENITNGNEAMLDVFGQIVRDGVLLNERYKYDEAFGFQLMNGKPFYYYKRNNQIDVSYNNQEIILGYSQIPHYQCCSAGALDPRSAKNMVAFYAQRDGKWYYVEIGVYKKL